VDGCSAGGFGCDDCRAVAHPFSFSLERLIFP
jgi:hypothetical protein